jgi:hypothetical protein
MNWYKKAQNLEEKLENVEGLDNIIQLLKEHNVEYEKIQFNNEIILKVNYYKYKFNK